MRRRRRRSKRQVLGLVVAFAALTWAAGVAVGDLGAGAAAPAVPMTLACSALAGLEGDPGGIYEAGMFVFDQASGDCLEGNSSCAVGRPKE